MINFSRFLRSKIEAQLGFKIEIVDKSEEFISKIEKETPDLAIVDLVMPEVDGFAILQTMQSTPALAQIPAIVVSNLKNPADMEKAKQLGAKEYHIKSITMLDEIVLAIQRNLSL